MTVEQWRTRPYTLGEAINHLLEQAFISFNGSAGASADAGFHSLPVNVWETPDAYHAALLMPGADEQSVSATVQDDTLVVEGELKLRPPEGGKVIWQEFGPAKFRRTLRLGAAIDASRVEAHYRDGILRLSLPKAESAKPRRIQVKVAAASGK